MYLPLLLIVAVENNPLHAGAAANFLLLSWLNALYSFDYKWALTNRRLPERIQIFEQHWAFFAGTTLLTLLLLPLFKPDT